MSLNARLLHQAYFQVMHEASEKRTDVPHPRILVWFDLSEESIQMYERMAEILNEKLALGKEKAKCPETPTTTA